MIKHIQLSLVILLAILASCSSGNKSNTEKKDSINTAVKITPIEIAPNNVIESFVQAYIEKDNKRVNELIHPDLGLYVIYRPGAGDTYEKVDSLNFSTPFPPHFPYTTFENTYQLAFDKLPEYDCGYDRWDKLGFFCDTTRQADQLSQIANFQYEFEEISQTQLEKIEEFEQHTYRVILTKNENLIFHIKKYKGNWYVVVLDRAYGWCDA